MSPLRVAALLAAFATPALAQAPAAPASTAAQTVDVMNKLWGRHPGLRANHARGVVAEGSFTPTAEAAELSTASIFAGKPVPVTVTVVSPVVGPGGGVSLLAVGAGAAGGM